MNYKQMIDRFLQDEAKESSSMVRSMLITKVTRYDDIRDEFLRWLDKRDYEASNPVVVEGYTAKEIHKLAKFLDGIGVYNFLTDLRDNPEQGKQYIAEGFRVL